jgi:hypothetical protein
VLPDLTYILLDRFWAGASKEKGHQPNVFGGTVVDGLRNGTSKGCNPLKRFSFSIVSSRINQTERR